MKGKLLLWCLSALVLLSAVACFIWKIEGTKIFAHLTPITLTRSSLASEKSPQIIASLHAILLVHATPPPLHCFVIQNGQLLLSESNAIASGEYRTDVEIAKGVSLLVKAEWQDEEPHSLRTEVLVQGYQTPLEKTFWAQQSLEDTFPIPASFLP